MKVQSLSSIQQMKAAIQGSGPAKVNIRSLLLDGLDGGGQEREPPERCGVAHLLEHLWHLDQPARGGGERDDGVGVDDGWTGARPVELAQLDTIRLTACTDDSLATVSQRAIMAAPHTTGAGAAAPGGGGGGR